MLRTVLDFLKNPLYVEDSNENFRYRIVVFLKLLWLSLLLSLSLGLLLDGIVSIFDLDLGKHASEILIEDYSSLRIALLAVILAPILEELFFRGPLVWFRSKSYFRYVFYGSVFAFGSIHLSNFEAYENAYWLTPLLIAPQLVLGVTAGFIRVRFGLLWAIALHVTYNLILIGPVIFIKVLDIKLE